MPERIVRVTETDNKAANASFIMQAAEATLEGPESGDNTDHREALFQKLYAEDDELQEMLRQYGLFRDTGLRRALGRNYAFGRKINERIEELRQEVENIVFEADEPVPDFEEEQPVNLPGALGKISLFGNRGE
jgi:hypothetical protein